MPELTSESIPPAVPAVPPSIHPDAWEDFPVFRESFLMYLTPPGLNAALRLAAESFFTLLLEHSGEDGWPEWQESTTRTELRAAIGDMRHLQGFLASIGQERHVTSLDAGDAKLSKHASKVARLLNQVATTLERKLAAGAV